MPVPAIQAGIAASQRLAKGTWLGKGQKKAAWQESHSPIPLTMHMIQPRVSLSKPDNAMVPETLEADSPRDS